MNILKIYSTYLTEWIIHEFRVEAPLLVVLGVDDLLCPPSQGREFHRALKARGIPTRYGTLVLDARLHNGL
jgi:pimeloyl-ACP methyl ester carboxylesterase